MNRWVAGLTVAVVGLLLVLGWNRHAFRAGGDAPGVASAPESTAAVALPPPDAQVVAASEPVESVRIEYELVQARTVVSPVPARAALLGQPRRAEARRDSRRFALRASRMIVGDGRYRPEPFPRPATR